METDSPAKQTRIAAFDGLRGLLAWWVVIGHILYAFGDAWGNASGNGFAVHVFIILSGFVITYLLDTQKAPYFAYLGRRWLRLYPVYILLLLLGALIGTLEIAGIQGSLFLDGNIEQASRLLVLQIEQSDFWRHFIAHLLLLHGAIPNMVMPQADSTFLMPAWSLSLEWQYYLVAPFVVWSISSVKRWGYLFAFILVLFLGLLVPGYKTTTGYLPIMMQYFAYGIGSYYIWRERDDPFWAKIVPWGLALFAFNQAVQGEVGTLVWLVVFAALMDIGSTAWNERVLSILETPALQYLGRQSYPVYLGHMPVYFLMMYALRPLTGAPVLWSVCLAVGTIVGSFALAALLHKYVEVPCQRLGLRGRAS